MLGSVGVGLMMKFVSHVYSLRPTLESELEYSYNFFLNRKFGVALGIEAHGKTIFCHVLVS